MRSFIVLAAAALAVAGCAKTDTTNTTDMNTTTVETTNSTDGMTPSMSASNGTDMMTTNTGDMGAMNSSNTMMTTNTTMTNSAM